MLTLRNFEFHTSSFCGSVMIAFALALVGCASGSMVWRKPSGENLTVADTIACGAMRTSSNTLEVPAGMNASHETCLRSKGYARVRDESAKTTSTWQIGQPKPRDINDPEYRRAISRNAPNVKVHQSCADLFVPVIDTQKFEGLLSMWHVTLLNNTQKRYSAKVDVVYERDGRSGRTSEEHTIVVRAGTLLVYPLTNIPAQGFRVVGVDVFRCDS